MNEKTLEQANRIKQDLERITQTKRDIMTYLNERLELDITVKKGLMHFNADKDSIRHYTLFSDSPLFVAIASALEGMREELINQFNALDSNTVEERNTNPIEKTSWFNKAFSWAQIGIQKCYDTKKARRNKIEGKIGKILFDFIVDREKIDDNDTSSLLRVANECTQLRNRIVSELDFYIDK